MRGCRSSYRGTEGFSSEAGGFTAEPLPSAAFLRSYARFASRAIFAAGSSSGTTWIRSCVSGGVFEYEHQPIATLMIPIKIIPPVTGIQYFRCLRENGRARSLDTPTLYHAIPGVAGATRRRTHTQPAYVSSCSIFERIQSNWPFSTIASQCVHLPTSSIASAAPQFGQLGVSVTGPRRDELRSRVQYSV